MLTILFLYSLYIYICFNILIIVKNNIIFIYKRILTQVGIDTISEEIANLKDLTYL